MKAVILAGGYGTRLSEETGVRPKPMVEIGGRPIIWHIMKIYAAHGITEFVVSAGYKSQVIKDYFANHFLHSSDVTFDLRTNEMTTHATVAEPWRVTIADTGDGTMTGGRLKRVSDHLDGETFCMTYGDCVADVDVTRLVEFHHEQRVLATLTAVQPPGRFGALTLAESGHVTSFHEKPGGDGGWVNGGFFVLEPGALDYIQGDTTVWEGEPMERLAGEGQLAAYKHSGFWQPMDSLRDKMVLEEQWSSGSPRWKTW
jgi:glucose-1-phosphate cytidylyltransferase